MWWLDRWTYHSGGHSFMVSIHSPLLPTRTHTHTRTAAHHTHTAHAHTHTRAHTQKEEKASFWLGRKRTFTAFTTVPQQSYATRDTMPALPRRAHTGGRAARASGRTPFPALLPAVTATTCLVHWTLRHTPGIPLHSHTRSMPHTRTHGPTPTIPTTRAGGRRPTDGAVPRHPSMGGGACPTLPGVVGGPLFQHTV